MANLFETFKSIDEHFQLIPGADGHILFIPRRYPAYIMGKALKKVNTTNGLPNALKQSLTDYRIIPAYLKNAPNFSNFGTRFSQVAVDTFCCNVIGLPDDVGAGLSGAYSAHRLKQMHEAIIRNETMRGPIAALKDSGVGSAVKKRLNRRITLRLRGPKGFQRNLGLPEKLQHPPFEELFNTTNSSNHINSIRGGAIEFDEISNKQRFIDLVLENKNRISFIVICAGIFYIFFKKFSFVRKFYRKIQKIQNHPILKKIRKIPNHWIFTNRITRGFIILIRCNRQVY